MKVIAQQNAISDCKFKTNHNMFHNVIRILADHCSCASFNDKHVERNPATVPVKSKDAKK